MGDVERARGPVRPIIGWREWVGLPQLGVPTIKAKVDTGARTSSLHAFDVEEYGRSNRRRVRFRIHPEQRSSTHEVAVDLPVHDSRNVRPSSGRAELRPVVVTEVELLGLRFDVEFTLTSRDEMGFRMLLGRQATRRRFLVDPGSSFQGGKRAKGKRRLHRSRTRGSKHTR